MRRDPVFVALSVPLALVAVFFVSRVDFTSLPREERIAGDVGAVRDGCLDWWCRGQDVFFAGLAAALLATALMLFWWGMRRRER
jgi:hypothetical protein